MNAFGWPTLFGSIDRGGLVRSKWHKLWALPAPPNSTRGSMEVTEWVSNIVGEIGRG